MIHMTLMRAIREGVREGIRDFFAPTIKVVRFLSGLISR